MRVWVGRKCAIFGRRLIKTNSTANAVIEITEPFQCCMIGATVERVEKALFHRQQKLGNHMPVNRSQSFEPEHGAGAPRERLVVEHFLVEIKYCPAGYSIVFGVAIANRIESCLDVAGVREFRAEADAAVDVF